MWIDSMFGLGPSLQIDPIPAFEGNRHQRRKQRAEWLRDHERDANGKWRRRDVAGLGKKQRTRFTRRVG